MFVRWAIKTTNYYYEATTSPPAEGFWYLWQVACVNKGP